MMQKRMISFTEPQCEYLDAEATRLGISVADLVRRIIDKYRQQPELFRRIIDEFQQKLDNQPWLPPVRH